MATLKKVGLRELKNRMGAYFRQVRRGATILVTDRGKPIARISPSPLEAANGKTLEDVLQELAAAGHIRLAERRGPLPDFTPIAAPGKAASRILLEDRR